MPEHKQLLAPLSAITVAALLTVGAENPPDTAHADAPRYVRKSHTRTLNRCV